MAIDMIENNELGALAPSRLGLRQFADDGKKYGYRNFTGDEQFYNLFGSKTRKESLARVEQEAKTYWAKFPLQTCEDAKKLLDLTLAEVESLNKRLAATNGKDPFIPVWIRVTREIEGNARKLYVSLDCEAKEAERKREAAKKETLDLAVQLGDTSVQKAQAELQGLQGQLTNETGGLDNKKILTYGAIGVGGLILIALILRR